MNKVFLYVISLALFGAGAYGYMHDLSHWGWWFVGGVGMAISASETK